LRLLTFFFGEFLKPPLLHCPLMLFLCNDRQRETASGGGSEPEMLADRRSRRECLCLSELGNKYIGAPPLLGNRGESGAT
jgi:hypothetical protein